MSKSSKKKVLGRGISALLNNDLKEGDENKSNQLKKDVSSFIEIPLDNISTNPFQPRLNFNDESLNELAASINELGLIQPITVRKISKNLFQLVSGERRLRAAKLINLKKIPCYIRKINDQESL